jgi:acyl-CoA reductase-like NAD-dependent aldehyde dehydrogenase
MTKDDIIRMAKEADLWMTSDERIAAVERFAELVVTHEREEFAIHAIDIARRAIAEEREACAKVADEWVSAYEHPSKVIAETIRKRG